MKTKKVKIPRSLRVQSVHHLMFVNIGGTTQKRSFKGFCGYDKTIISMMEINMN